MSTGTICKRAKDTTALLLCNIINTAFKIITISLVTSTFLIHDTHRNEMEKDDTPHVQNLKQKTGCTQISHFWHGQISLCSACASHVLCAGVAAKTVPFGEVFASSTEFP